MPLSQLNTIVVVVDAVVVLVVDCTVVVTGGFVVVTGNVVVVAAGLVVVTTIDVVVTPDVVVVAAIVVVVAPRVVVTGGSVVVTGTVVVVAPGAVVVTGSVVVVAPPTVVVTGRIVVTGALVVVDGDVVVVDGQSQASVPLGFDTATSRQRSASEALVDELPSVSQMHSGVQVSLPIDARRMNRQSLATGFVPLVNGWPQSRCAAMLLEGAAQTEAASPATTIARTRPVLQLHILTHLQIENDSHQLRG